MRMIKTLLLAFTTFTLNAYAGLIVNTSEFIDDTNLTHFNGFELSTKQFRNGKNFYVEDGIQVRQILGDGGKDINLGLISLEGNRTWAPNGGDNGYTEISLANGAGFIDLEFLFVAPNLNNQVLFYNLFNDGEMVLAGTLDIGKRESGVLGFEGGGFDQVLLRSGGRNATFFDGSVNALTIDSIQVAGIEPVTTSVPEPSAFVLFVLALAGISIRRRKLT
ncbi:PEP-CTERM sorting domain-containing protein [Endozoicomonas sp. G2_1]|uniref:PEP-CTERM sorting domain-containing protein n=1 Tax=Endozoicomonas sp. G2_1 TaxID=2821091 RepID=UPI001ADA860E|nr:PEP-CTERM sorting domain-containing protein [Endozoicomonas sp. G2_1]MBO9490114.1 PEP-CTERM sorting domain-containing protein [Endozoicomonas sp. G2_1]